MSKVRIEYSMGLKVISGSDWRLVHGYRHCEEAIRQTWQSRKK